MKTNIALVALIIALLLWTDTLTIRVSRGPTDVEQAAPMAACYLMEELVMLFASDDTIGKAVLDNRFDEYIDPYTVAMVLAECP